MLFAKGFAAYWGFKKGLEAGALDIIGFYWADGMVELVTVGEAFFKKGFDAPVLA